MTKIKQNTLIVSEKFYSVQGEGITSGYPAYFIRLANCNLSCGATMKFVNQFKKGERTDTPGSFKGELHDKGLATWTCDSIPVWARGTNMEYQQIIDDWINEGVEHDIRTGLIHVIWTGGEPTMPHHQKAIAGFHDYYMDWVVMNGGNINTFTPYYEIETNGTIEITDDFLMILDQINCSAKLQNSGMKLQQRIQPKALRSIMSHDNYMFKFVISNETDIEEIFNDYITPFQIPLKRVICMPGMDSRDNFHERTQWVMEMAKKYKFIGLTRLHLSAWDKATGV